MDDASKTKRERITEYIEEYLEKFVKDKVTLIAGEIRKWPVVDEICLNTDPANICRAMKSVSKYRWEIIGGKEESTTFELQYFKERNLLWNSKQARQSRWRAERARKSSRSSARAGRESSMP